MNKQKLINEITFYKSEIRRLLNEFCLEEDKEKALNIDNEMKKLAVKVVELEAELKKIKAQDKKERTNLICKIIERLA